MSDPLYPLPPEAQEQPLYAPSGELLYNPPAQDDNRLASAPEPQGAFSRGVNRLLGTQFGEDRYQMWPEKTVRSGFTLPGDVYSGAEPIIDPATGQPSEHFIERTQDTAALAMTGGLAGTGERGMVVGSGPVRRTAMTEGEKGPVWHSPVENALEQSTTGSAPGKQWLATLQNARGVKPEELEWSGLKDFLETKGNEKVTRQELHEHLDNNRVQLKDVEKGTLEWKDMTPAQRERVTEDYREFTINHEDDIDLARVQRHYERHRDQYTQSRDQGGTKYHDYQLPGGENYREHLLTLPEKGDALARLKEAEVRKEQAWRDASARDSVNPESDPTFQRAMGDYMSLMRETEGGRQTSADNYRSSHWDEPNIVAHVRTNDRVMGDKKSLHLEEVQSDWHQEGRKKGYQSEHKLTPEETAKSEYNRMYGEGGWDRAPEDTRSNWIRDASRAGGIRVGVPDAPFKTTWPELAMKRMIRRAAEEGYDRISWTPGEAQAARYDLSKHIDNLAYQKNGNEYSLVGKKGDRSVLNQTVFGDKLADVVGKDVAERIVNDQGKEKPGAAMKYLEGVDLKVGGEGMREFYDKMLPRVAEKIGKAHGVKVQRGQLPSDNIRKTVDDRYTVVGDRRTFDTMEEAQKAAGAPVHYFDIPQSLRDQALRKGMPLFSGGKMFVPAQRDDKEKK